MGLWILFQPQKDGQETAILYAATNFSRCWNSREGISESSPSFHRGAWTKIETSISLTVSVAETIYVGILPVTIHRETIS